MTKSPFLGAVSIALRMNPQRWNERQPRKSLAHAALPNLTTLRHGSVA